MTWADRITLMVMAPFVLAWLVLFGLTIRDRRYIPRHRWKPAHRA